MYFSSNFILIFLFFLFFFWLYSIFLDYVDWYYLFLGFYEGIFYCLKENLVSNFYVLLLMFFCLIILID